MKNFWDKVKKGKGCWEWTGYIHPSGYGMFRFQGKTPMAHRVAWILTHGEIPRGMKVLHRCDYPGCVNPDHLFLGTQRDNVLDMYGKGRGVAGERHHRSKLSINDAINIRILDIPIRTLADLYGVHHGTIHAIKAGRTWKQATLANPIGRSADIGGSG
jgi:HNH endonuclease